MKEVVYNKLVRDRIPEIMEKNGEKPITSILDDKEYFNQLLIKLKEEVNEFLESEEIEELADILEVIIAISEFKNTSYIDLELIRKDKSEKRGAFKNRIYLEKKYIK